MEATSGDGGGVVAESHGQQRRGRRGTTLFDELWRCRVLATRQEHSGKVFLAALGHVVHSEGGQGETHCHCHHHHHHVHHSCCCCCSKGSSSVRTTGRLGEGVLILGISFRPGRRLLKATTLSKAALACAAVFSGRDATFLSSFLKAALPMLSTRPPPSLLAFFHSNNASCVNPSSSLPMMPLPAWPLRRIVASPWGRGCPGSPQLVQAHGERHEKVAPRRSLLARTPSTPASSGVWHSHFSISK